MLTILAKAWTLLAYIMTFRRPKNQLFHPEIQRKHQLRKRNPRLQFRELLHPPEIQEATLETILETRGRKITRC